MIEYTIATWMNGSDWHGYGTVGSPTAKQRSLEVVSYAFVRRDTRIHVLSFEEVVTQEVARSFAVALYEGRVQKIDLNDSPHTRLTTVHGGELFT